MSTGPEIHPTAVVSPQAEIHPSVRIGPMCHVGPGVQLGEDCHLIASVFLEGPTRIGARATIFPYAVIGTPPQHTKFQRGDPTPGILIGDDATIREHATIHTAYEQELPTTIGDRVFMMTGSHIGHDCLIGNDFILTNHASLGGHCQIGDRVVISACVAVHQFVRIGRMAMIAGNNGVLTDVPPFFLSNHRFRVTGVNLVGLRRAGFPREHITAIRRAFKAYFHVRCDTKPTIAALREQGEREGIPPLLEIADFVEQSKRGIAAGIGANPPGLKQWLSNLGLIKNTAIDDDDDR